MIGNDECSVYQTNDYYGLVDRNKTYEMFSRYDAFVFPAQSENFGHVIAIVL